MADDQDDLPVVLMATLPVMAVRLGVGFLRFQSSRKRGVRRFRRTLLEGGMPRDQAGRLAQAFHDTGSFRKILQGTLSR
ncbi:MAG TPA: hypothetical protein VIB49_07885 [Thermoplasmata archaeon]|jgi:hypothetical protein